MTFADKLIILRKKNGLSQEELADRLNVSRQAISRWELGSTMPDAPNLLQLSTLFNVSTDYLLHDDYESDNDIPSVKETNKQMQEKDTKQSKMFLISACLWLFAAICWSIAASINFNILHVWNIVLGILLSCFNFYQYAKKKS